MRCAFKLWVLCSDMALGFEAACFWMKRGKTETIILVRCEQ